MQDPNVDGKWEDITMDKIVSVDGMESLNLLKHMELKRKVKRKK